MWSGVSPAAPISGVKRGWDRATFFRCSSSFGLSPLSRVLDGGEVVVSGAQTPGFPGCCCARNPVTTPIAFYFLLNQ